MTGGGCLEQKKGNEGSKPFPRTRTAVRTSSPTWLNYATSLPLT